MLRCVVDIDCKRLIEQFLELSPVLCGDVNRFGKGNQGAALRPPDRSIARARLSRARSIEPPAAAGLPPSYTIIKS